MVDTAHVFPMHPIAEFSSALSLSVKKKGNSFWRENSATDGNSVNPGCWVSRGKAEPVENSGCGSLIPTYRDTFYNTIFLIPKNIDFGAVVSDITRTFFIWNAYLTPRPLQAVTVQDGEGLKLGNPTPPPSVYKPLQFTQFSLTASTTGPALIDARFNFTFDVRTVQLSVVGIRAEIWDLLPNWRNPYKISYEYKTEIFTSRSGKEQRRALRQTARKRLDFSVQATHQKMWRLRALMDAWQDKSFVLPELTRSITSVSGLPSNGIQMTVSDTPTWIRPGAILVLQDGERNGLRIIESVDGNELTFTSGSAETWPAGTTIFPGLNGRVQPDQATRHLTSQVAELDFRFDELPGSESVADTGVPFETYNGSEVFLKEPNWLHPLNMGFQWDAERLDYDRGVVEVLPLHTFGQRTHQATFLSRNRSQAVEIEQFFNRTKGRRGSFYMPTWEPDILPAADLSQLNRFMTVEGDDLARYYGSSSVFRHMFIRFHDGSYMIRPVVAISEQSGNSIIDTGTEWPRDISLSEILMICWLPRWRFSSDILSIEWLTDEVAQFQLTMQTLEDAQ